MNACAIGANQQRFKCYNKPRALVRQAECKMRISLHSRAQGSVCWWKMVWCHVRQQWAICCGASRGCDTATDHNVTNCEDLRAAGWVQILPKLRQWEAQAKKLQCCCKAAASVPIQLTWALNQLKLTRNLVRWGSKYTLFFIALPHWCAFNIFLRKIKVRIFNSFNATFPVCPLPSEAVAPGLRWTWGWSQCTSVGNTITCGAFTWPQPWGDASGLNPEYLN